jgi:hypothetical protein
MKPDRIRAVWRPSGEDTGERNTLVVHRMGLQNGAVGLVQPRDHDQLSARSDSMERRREVALDVKGGSGRAGKGLIWGVSRLAEGRSHHAYGLNHDWRHRLFSSFR